jgi:hypothetical protein
LVDEVGEVDEWGRFGGEFCLDRLEAGEENFVTGYFGGEGLDVEFACFSLFMDVALFPADKRFLVDVGVTFDI